MTVRMASCRELSEDREAVSRLAKHYWAVEKNATPVTILFPWFPSSAKKAKQKATLALYTTILSYVEGRRKSSTPSMDPIDLFILEGSSNDKLVGVSPLRSLSLSINVATDCYEYYLCWSD